MTPTPDAQAVLNRLAAAKASSGTPAGSGPDIWLAAYRDSLTVMAEFTGLAPALHAAEELSIDVGGFTIGAWLLRPLPGVLPCLVYFHGGGFIAGRLDTHRPALAQLAAATGWAVLAVDYRLAPELPFPAAPEDGYAALTYAASLGSHFSLDPARLAVAGDSAGGTLAAAVAMMARDRGGPALLGQVLLYPNMDLRPDRTYPSMAEYDGKVVDLGELARSLAMYLPDAETALHPYASPVLADSLAGMPPALLVTCECDPLRDEGRRYGARLADAGVDVDHKELAGAIHGAVQMAGATSAGQTLMQAVARWLNKASPAA